MAYNGWTNYQTWAVNVHIGDYLQECTNEFAKSKGYILGNYELSRHLKQCFEDLYAEQLDEILTQSPLLYDLLSNDTIDWCDLAQHCMDDITIESED
jgi:hypothetical protein